MNGCLCLVLGKANTAGFKWLLVAKDNFARDMEMNEDHADGLRCLLFRHFFIQFSYIKENPARRVFASTLSCHCDAQNIEKPTPNRTRTRREERAMRFMMYALFFIATRWKKCTSLY